ncbi:MAG: UDP-glucose 4-epimerase GalE [Xanthomonadales bacterium]|nr:UDP-glucose 4-epimerase GalE [Xanthomonadales bacterium]
MTSTKPTVLVTGGAGHIGSQTCKALAASGYLPVAVDNMVYGHEWAVRWGPLEVADILDGDRLDQIILRYKPRAVLHFAAYAYVGESVMDPGKYYRNNVVGSLSLLQAMARHSIDRMVFSSTCATYGNPLHLPIREDHPQAPINPYGASKQMVERIMADFGVAHGLRSTALRYFNAAGADPDGELGEHHDPETHLIPLVLDAASGKRSHIEIYGDDYDTADGTCVRDYIHVADLADAHVLALSRLEGAEPGMRPYNLGNGKGHSVREVIAAAERVTGLTVPTLAGPRRAGDPENLVGDATQALRELGWQPKHADLETIVQHAWRWHQKNSNTHARDAKFA